MTEGAATRPAHERRRHRLVVAAALVATAAIAVAMAQAGHLPDLPTAVLVSGIAVTVGAGRRADLLRRPAAGPAFDEIDPATGVGNARAVLALLDREGTRARTYGSLYSVAVLEVDRPVFAGLPARRAHRVLVDLVRGVATDVRVGDRVCRVSTSDRELIVVVLPDTGTTGAQTFAGRLVAQARRHLQAEGVTPDGFVRTEVLSQPDDGLGLRRLQRRVEVLEGTDALIRDVVTVGQREVVGARGRGT